MVCWIIRNAVLLTQLLANPEVSTLLTVTVQLKIFMIFVIFNFLIFMYFETAASKCCDIYNSQKAWVCLTIEIFKKYIL